MYRLVTSSDARIPFLGKVRSLSKLIKCVLTRDMANLCMGYFEDKFVHYYHLQPFIWKRFIDDIFSLYGLQEFVD